MPTQTITLIPKTLYFFIPAGIANMAPVIFRNINFLNYSINEKLFGSHKTYRGIFFGIILAIFATFLQFLLTNFNFSLINYTTSNFILIGFLLGFGAMLGDLVKSFFKRRLSIKPGNSFIPFDQLDWIIGAIIFTFPLINYSILQILFLLIVYGLLHPLINLMGYVLKIKKNRF